MPENSLPRPLYHIAECPDLMADACLGDEDRSLVFLSLWGRDTAAQEFLARLTLRDGERGLDHFHLITDDVLELAVIVKNVEMLEKRTTRAYRGTLFGSLVHCWLFDKRCIMPDKANASALAVLPKDTAHQTQRLWTLVQQACPLPLLDHWRDVVLELLQTRTMLSRLPFALGDLEGYRLALDVPTLTLALGDLIRNDTLSVCQSESPALALRDAA